MVDAPGIKILPDLGGALKRAVYKAKFREWVQVEIGAKRYVCSPYNNWRSIVNVKHDNGKWQRDNTKINEVLEGHTGLAGFSGVWSE